jgi:hypothetical protein
MNELPVSCRALQTMLRSILLSSLAVLAAGAGVLLESAPEFLRPYFMNQPRVAMEPTATQGAGAAHMHV